MTYAAQVYAGEFIGSLAFGGRVDQFLANIFLLAHPTLNGRLVRFFDQYPMSVAAVDAAHGAVEIHGQWVTRCLCCLQAPRAHAIIEHTSGLQWPLHLSGRLLAFGPARGIQQSRRRGCGNCRGRNGRLLHPHPTKLAALCKAYLAKGQQPLASSSLGQS
ncbi:MAG: hypothetical protein R3E31_22830 [Chloroflexota bacterium]